MTAMSLIGNRLFRPSASIASPPTPEKATSPDRASRSARMSLKPSWSPECSPATRATRNGLIRPGADTRIRRRTGRRRRLSRAQTLALEHEHMARGDRHAPQLRLDRAFNRLRPDRRHVEPEILPALRRFHQDARRAGKAQPAAWRASPRRAQASRRCLRPPRSPAPGRRRQPRPAPRRRSTALRGGARQARCPSRPPRTAARAPIGPSGARRRGATSCAPTTRTPSRSMIAARPASSPLSPRRNSCASPAARFTAPQSSLRSANSGLVIAPMITISAMARSFRAANSLPTSPIRTQTCG